MKVYTIMHPAALFYNPKLTLATRLDWAKVPRVLSGEWPKPLPPRVLATTAGTMYEWFSRVPHTGYVVVDTEYTVVDLPAVGRLTWFGAVTSEGLGLQVHVATADKSAYRMLADCFRELVAAVPIVFHNAQADLPVLESAFSVSPRQYLRIEDTMLLHAVLWSELPHDLEFLASIYGEHGNPKALRGVDAADYNWADVVTTWDCWRKLNEEARPVDLQIYRDQLCAQLPMLVEATYRGIRVNIPAVKVEDTDLEAEIILAQAAARIYTQNEDFNLGSPAQVAKQLYDVEEIKPRLNRRKRTVDADAVADMLRTMPDHGLLLARKRYATAKQLQSHYTRPFLASGGTIYPQFHTHAQETGRTSIVDPPLSQLPKKPRDYRAFLRPRPGECWVHWDWSGIEEHLMGALTGETSVIEAYARGEDVHEKQAVAIFGDVARGKAEPYRVFTKRFKYRLYYGGDPKACTDIPGVSQLGLDGKQLEVLAHRFLLSMPKYLEWRSRVAADLLNKPYSEDFTGRRRYLLATPILSKYGKLNSAARNEAWNNPLQMGVASILNLTCAALDKHLPWAHYVFTMHDAGWWGGPSERVSELQQAVQQWVTRPWEIKDQYGTTREIRFGAEIEVIT